jgi:hydrophobic/amphiphilic exporter-1 (mainly G- bacteria), HAE1 family
MSRPAPKSGGRAYWSLPEFALNRPITIAMALIGLLGLGVIVWNVIRVEFIMTVDFPVISCYIPYPGATPEQVEIEVAVPAEGEFRTVSDLRRIYSRSDGGGCHVRMWFDWNTNMAVAMNEVRARLERLKLHLPDGVDRVFLRRDSSDAFPVIDFTLLTDQDPVELAQWTRSRLHPLLMRLPGVADVEVSGTGGGSVYIDFDQEALQRNNLDLYEVVTTLRKSHFKVSVGDMLDGDSKCLVRLESEYADPQELRNTVVGPNAIRLGDVATVNYHGEGTGSSHKIDGKRGVFVRVQKESEANTIETCAAVKAELKRIQSDPMLAGVEVFIFGDHSQNIMDAIRLLGKAGRNGGILALLVLFLFMRRVRATLIVATSIPISLVAAFVAIYFMGMTLNTVTMASMIICVGLLVDNSIVVMENIQRHRRLGMDQFESAREGAREVGLAITATTLTTVVVFIPVFYMENNEMSIYMREFCTPVVVAVLCSMAVSLTVIPLAASHLKSTPPFTRSGGTRSPGSRRMPAVTGLMARMKRTLGKMHLLLWIHASYNTGLAWAMRRRLAACVITGAIAAITLLVPFRQVGMQRLPTVDVRRVEVSANFDANYDWPRAEKVFDYIEDLMDSQREELGIKNVYVRGGTHGGSVRGYLPQLHEYGFGQSPPYSTAEVRAILASQLPERVPGGSVHVRATPGTAGTLKSISVRMRGDDTQVLAGYAEEFKRRLESLPNVVDAVAETEDAKQEIQLEIDETLASHAGISPYRIARTVDFALRGTRLFHLKRKEREVPVQAQFQSEDRRNMADLDNVTLQGSTGTLVPLSQLVQKQKAQSPKAIQRVNGKNVVVVTAQATTENLTSVKRDLDELIAQFHLPLGYDIETGEELTELDVNLKSFNRALILALILIYVVMGALFESYLLPLSILTSVPLAFIGVYWGLFLTNTQMDAIALVGAILMCGVVVNNGIVIVDHINQLRRRGCDRREAILKAADDRYRPVMMTALTTIGGCIPLAMGTSLGEVAFHSLGRALIGGLTTGTLLTLFVVPVFYSLIDDLRLWFLDYFACLAGTQAAAGK